NKIISYHIMNKPQWFIINNAFYHELKRMPANRILNYPANRDSIYCYQLKPGKPAINPDGLRDYIRMDLQRTFHFTGAIKQKKIGCLVIKEIKRMDQLASKHSVADMAFSKQTSVQKYIRHTSFQDALNRLDQLSLPIINETKYASELVDFEFPMGFDPENEQELITWFTKNGFVVSRENRLITVFEFSSTL